MFPFALSAGCSDSIGGQSYSPATQQDEVMLEADECTQAEFSEPALNDAEAPEFDGAPQPWGRLIDMQGEASPMIDLQPREEGMGRALNQVVLGRKSACDVQVGIDDMRVSNFHCRIFCMRSTSSFGSDALEVYIEDTSTHGTWINGDTHLRCNQKRLLNSGDEITLSRAPRSPISFTFVRLNRSRHIPGGLNAGAAASSGVGSSSDGDAAAAAAGAAGDGAAGASLSQQQNQPLLRSATLAAGNISDDYDVRHVIGNGQCGEVRMAIQRRSGKPVAVKEIKTKRFKMTPGLSAGELVQEAEMLRAVTHPYIVKLEDIYMTDSALYLVMELVEGGDLFDRIIEKGTYEEPLARDLMSRVLTAVAYLHSKDIVHRDLKPENILLARRDNDVDVKITDFGLAKRANKEGLKTFCGTPQYFAPEVLKRRNTVKGAGRYGKEADMWSLGVILYILLSGTHPFNDETLFEQIQGAWYSVDGPEWEAVSAEAKDLIAHLLVADPEDRLSADGALQHPFITGQPLSTAVAVKVSAAAAAGASNNGDCRGSAEAGQGGDMDRNSSSCTTMRSSSSSGDDAAAAPRAAGPAKWGQTGSHRGISAAAAEERTLSTPSSADGVGAFAGIIAAADASPISKEQPEGAGRGRGDAAAAAVAAGAGASADAGGGGSGDGQTAARRTNKPAARPRGRRGGGASAYSQLTMVAGEAGDSPECDAPADARPAAPAAAGGGVFRLNGFATASSGAATASAATATRAVVAPSTAAERIARLGARGGGGGGSAAGTLWKPMGLSATPAASASAAPSPAVAAGAARFRRPDGGCRDAGGGSSGGGGGADDIDEYSSDGTPAKPRAQHQVVPVEAVPAGGGKASLKGRAGKGRGAGKKPDWAVPTPGKGARRRAKELGGGSANGGTISHVMDSITQLKIASPGSAAAAAAAAGAGMELAPAPFHDMANVREPAVAAGVSAGGAAVKRKPTAGRVGNAAGDAAASRAPKKAKPAGAAPQRTITSYLK